MGEGVRRQLSAHPHSTPQTVVKCVLIASPGFVKVGAGVRSRSRRIAQSLSFSSPPPHPPRPHLRESACNLMHVLQDQFLEYMFAQAVKTDNKTILENKALFIGVHASSGHKHALNEVLSDPAVASRLADTKVVKLGVKPGGGGRYRAHLPEHHPSLWKCDRLLARSTHSTISLQCCGTTRTAPFMGCGTLSMPTKTRPLRRSW